MKIILVAEDAIRLEGSPGPMSIEARSEDEHLSPFHLLAASLAACTYSVLYSWGQSAGLGVDGLALDVRWSFGDDPRRVDAIDLAFTWPELPAERLSAARRAAALCTVHATLQHPPAITIDGAVAGTAAGGR